MKEQGKTPIGRLPLLLVAGIILLFVVVLTRTPIDFGCSYRTGEFNCHAVPTVVEPINPTVAPILPNGENAQPQQGPRMSTAGASTTVKPGVYDPQKVKATPSKNEP